MVPREVIGGELRGDAAPAVGETGTEHRDLRSGAAERAQQVGQQARQGQPEQHQGDRQLLGGVGGAAGRGEYPRTDHAQHDRSDGHVLIAPRALAEHSLREQHQNEQARREGRLNDYERRQ